ncbi:MAG TPA: DUF1015 domain-containing protein [Actinomycetota bacterium]|nr:DUF1015 domain-containing protein [Actinomycetota bacterium]
MSKLVPFEALTYAPDYDLAKVTTPPYDVISPARRAELETLDEHSFVRVILPEAPDAAGTPAYREGAELFRSWIGSVLVRQPAESMFVYSMRFTIGSIEQQTAGVIAGLELERLGEGSVHPHERTLPAAKADRLEIMRNTRANLEPLWLFSAAPVEGFDRIVSAAMSQEPAADFRDQDEVEHRLWLVSEPATEQLTRVFAGRDLVIADGHHRYETSVSYRDERRATDGSGPWDFAMVFVVDPSFMAPPVLPIHRVVNATTEEVRRVIDLSPFTGSAEELGGLVSSGTGQIGLLSGSEAFTIEYEADLATRFLENSVLTRLGREVAYEHDLDEAIKKAGQGCVFVMPPASLPQVAEKARAGERMPPKTTLFWPKPRSGVVMRDLAVNQG